ncbi:hypothetical protein [Pseudomonas kurunegalensis]|nr:hypothetical protein [Pseudomonas kurunegalensis]WJD61536.1 hypothetical protein QQ992_21750 [Pseudomonas kurunegalensis]
MSDSKNSSQKQTQTEKAADREQPNKNSRPLPIVEGLENYKPPERK